MPFITKFLNIFKPKKEASDPYVSIVDNMIKAYENTGVDIPEQPEEAEESEWINPSDETLEQIMVECFKLKQLINAFEPNIDDEYIVKQHIQSFIDFLSAISGIEICWADVTDSYDNACIAAESSAGLSIIGYNDNTKVIYMNQVIKIPKLIDDDIHEFAYDITD
jgi:hypothetical protein